MDKYELSLWKQEYDADNNLIEQKLMVIGNDTHIKNDHLAYNIHFITNINETKTLTFDLLSYYKDPYTGERQRNILPTYCQVKSIIKLKVGDKWYSFVVKNITEKKEKEKGILVYSYSCSDLMVEELGKNGYSLTFTEEAEGGNVKTIHDFAESIVKGTKWHYDRDRTGSLPEYKTEQKFVDTPSGEQEIGTVYTPIPTYKQLYFPEIKRYGYETPFQVSVNGNRKKVYSYFGTEFTETTYVENLISNSKDFVSAGGWESRFPANAQTGTPYIHKDGDIRYLRIPLNKGNPTTALGKWTDLIFTYDLTSKQIHSNSLYFFKLNARPIRVKGGTETNLGNLFNLRIALIDDYGENRTDWSFDDQSTRSWFDGKENLCYKNGKGCFIRTPAKEMMKPTLRFRLFPFAYEGGEQAFHYLDIESIELYEVKFEQKKGKTLQELETVRASINQAIDNKYNTLGAVTYIEDVILSTTDNIRLSENYTNAYYFGNYIRLPEAYVQSVSNQAKYFFFYRNYEVVKPDGTTDLSYDYNNVTSEYERITYIRTLEDLNLSFKGDFQPYEYQFPDKGKVVYNLEKLKDYLENRDGKGIPTDILSPDKYAIQPNYQPRLDESDERLIYSLEGSTGEMSNRLILIPQDITINNPVQPELAPITKTYYINPFFLLSNNKRRTMTESKTNRYSLLTKLSEIFSVWLKFDIQYDEDGYILSKSFYFSPNSGNNSGLVFKYGLNMNSISRTYESDNLVSKLWVENLDTKLSKDSNNTVSIIDAVENNFGEQFIYNFNWFIKTGIVDGKKLNEIVGFDGANLESEHLYRKTLNFLVGNLNKRIYAKQKKIANLRVELVTLQADREAYEANYQAAVAALTQEQQNMSRIIKNMSTKEFKVGSWALNIPYDAKGEPVWFYEYGKTTDYTYANRLQNEYNDLLAEGDSLFNYIAIRRDTIPNLGSQALTNTDPLKQILATPALMLDSSIESWNENVRLYHSSKENIERIKDKIDKYNKIIDRMINFYPQKSEGYDNIIDQVIYEISNDVIEDDKYVFDKRFPPDEVERIQEYIANGFSGDNNWFTDDSICGTDCGLKIKQKLLSDFENSYSHIIKEGYWTDSNYIDDNEYYIGALNTSDVSSQPKLTYSIDVIDLPKVDDYAYYDFEEGDLAYVIDEDIFFEKNHKEPVIISQMDRMLDKPSDTKLTIQIYESRFQDLFKRISATVSTVELKDQKITNLTDLINSQGVVDSEILQKIYDQNKLLVNSSFGTNVKTDNSGITAFATDSPEKQVRISGGCIAVTKDGVNYTVAITPEGINTNALRAGSIDTSQVTILENNTPEYRLDRLGLTAYCRIPSLNKINSGQKIKLTNTGDINDNADGQIIQALKGNSVGLTISNKFISNEIYGQLKDEYNDWVDEYNTTAVTEENKLEKIDSFVDFNGIFPNENTNIPSNKDVDSRFYAWLLTLEAIITSDTKIDIRNKVTNALLNMNCFLSNLDEENTVAEYMLGTDEWVELLRTYAKIKYTGDVYDLDTYDGLSGAIRESLLWTKDHTTKEQADDNFISTLSSLPTLELQQIIQIILEHNTKLDSRLEQGVSSDVEYDALNNMTKTYTTIDTSSFIRHDKFGFYYMNNKQNFGYTTERVPWYSTRLNYDECIEDIWNNADFSLTKKGLYIGRKEYNSETGKVEPKGGYLKFEIKDKNGNSENKTKFEVRADEMLITGTDGATDTKLSQIAKGGPDFLRAYYNSRSMAKQDAAKLMETKGIGDFFSITPDFYEPKKSRIVIKSSLIDTDSIFSNRAKLGDNMYFNYSRGMMTNTVPSWDGVSYNETSNEYSYDSNSYMGSVIAYINGVLNDATSKAEFYKLAKAFINLDNINKNLNEMTDAEAERNYKTAEDNGYIVPESYNYSFSQKSEVYNSLVVRNNGRETMRILQSYIDTLNEKSKSGDNKSLSDMASLLFEDRDYYWYSNDRYTTINSRYRGLLDVLNKDKTTKVYSAINLYDAYRQQFFRRQEMVESNDSEDITIYDSPDLIYDKDNDYLYTNAFNFILDKNLLDVKGRNHTWDFNGFKRKIDTWTHSNTGENLSFSDLVLPKLETTHKLSSTLGEGFTTYIYETNANNEEAALTAFCLFTGCPSSFLGEYDCGAYSDNVSNRLNKYTDGETLNIFKFDRAGTDYTYDSYMRNEYIVESITSSACWMNSDGFEYSQYYYTDDKRETQEFTDLAHLLQFCSDYHTNKEGINTNETNMKKFVRQYFSYGIGTTDDITGFYAQSGNKYFLTTLGSQHAKLDEIFKDSDYGTKDTFYNNIRIFCESDVYQSTDPYFTDIKQYAASGEKTSANFYIFFKKFFPYLKGNTWLDSRNQSFEINETDERDFKFMNVIRSGYDLIKRQYKITEQGLINCLDFDDEFVIDDTTKIKKKGKEFFILMYNSILAEISMEGFLEIRKDADWWEVADSHDSSLWLKDSDDSYLKVFDKKVNQYINNLNIVLNNYVVGDRKLIDWNDFYYENLPLFDIYPYKLENTPTSKSINFIAKKFVTAKDKDTKSFTMGKIDIRKLGESSSYPPIDNDIVSNFLIETTVKNTATEDEFMEYIHNRLYDDLKSDIIIYGEENLFDKTTEETKSKLVWKMISPDMFSNTYLSSLNSESNVSTFINTGYFNLNAPFYTGKKDSSYFFYITKGLNDREVKHTQYVLKEGSYYEFEPKNKEVGNSQALCYLNSKGQFYSEGKCEFRGGGYIGGWTFDKNSFYNANNETASFKYLTTDFGKKEDFIVYDEKYPLVSNFSFYFGEPQIRSNEWNLDKFFGLDEVSSEASNYSKLRIFSISVKAKSKLNNKYNSRKEVIGVDPAGVLWIYGFPIQLSKPNPASPFATVQAWGTNQILRPDNAPVDFADNN